jgi:Holliday junction DNA helicase RuvB
MIEEDSLVSAENQENEAIIMTSVRPKLLSEYIGQKDVKSQMSLFIKATKKREVVRLTYLHAWLRQSK